MGASFVENYQRIVADDGSPKRICALVIGVDKYVCKPPLQNAVRDARAVGTELKSTGAVIINAINCTISELKDKIDEYLGLLRENDVGMLYFAGHGCEYNNAFRMFAISEGEESNIKTDSVNLLVLINRMKRKKTRAIIAILDCCRTFRYKATRGAKRGSTDDSLPTFFQPSESYHDKYSGVLIAHACAPNHSVSDDGGDGHGLFTRCLLEFLTTPGLDITKLFQLVNRAVRDRSDGKQVPYVHSSFVGEFILFSALLSAATAATSASSVEKGTDILHDQLRILEQTLQRREEQYRRFAIDQCATEEENVTAEIKQARQEIRQLHKALTQLKKAIDAISQLEDKAT